MDKSLIVKKNAIESYYFSGIWEPVKKSTTVNLKFETFFHPHVMEFIKGLNRKGVPGLLNLANQTLGNPYLHSPWKRSNRTISSSVSGGACLIEGSFGKSYNPIFDRPGNFEVVALEGKELWHYKHDNSDVTKPWEKVQMITNQADSPGCIIETISEGNFEAVVLKGNQLWHYTRDNSNQANPWVPQGFVSDQVTGPGCIIESSFISGGRHCLEAVVLEGSKLVHYRRNNATGKWDKQGEFITDKATGPGCVIQSSFKSGEHGNFEVVVLEGKELVHYSKDITRNQWSREKVITDAATSAGWIVQSRVRDSRRHGNFEVVVCEGSQLVHYWKDNSDPGSPWRRGQVITTKASGPGCIVHGSFGGVGNFEVVVPENGRLTHYWNVNEGQIGTEGERFYFWDEYLPTKYVDDPYPRHDLDFSYGGAYSIYNWEIFFHAPMLLATRLSQNQRFEDAMRWFHYIFNPTDDSHELTTHRYWKVLPLRDVEKQRIDHMLAVLSDPSKKGSPERQKIEDQLDDWGKNPFQPHRIARMRLIAYQKNVVMKYIDNLIAWGDQLFRRDTIESINGATQLYVLAAKLWGQQPQRIPRRGKAEHLTYKQLRPTLDAFSNTKKALENKFPFSSSFSSVRASSEITGLLGIGDTFYFCIPQNDKLLGYRDTISDRLFKIRHCMNIEGVVRQLPLFEPPIDPALLVQAAAKGVDIGSVLADLSTPLSYYRFSYMLQKALELCNDLKSLGAALLSALEKKDAEELAKTRATHERVMLEEVKKVKQKQLDEANASITALTFSRNISVTRWKHYQRMLGVENPQDPKFNQQINETPEATGFYKLEGGEGGTKITSFEKEDLERAELSRERQSEASDYDIAANIMHMIPEFEISGKPLGLGVGVRHGGNFIASALSTYSRSLTDLSAKYGYEAAKAAKLGSHVLRERDWVLQRNLAAKEIEQIDKQLVAAQIRREVADQELKNHEKQIENAIYIEEYLQTKYTNKELYTWMVSQISTIYFQSYQMAYDMARKAERAFRFERGLTISNFIQFGYWDSLREGLMAGERLHLSLKQMEQAYHEQNKREYEITKHVSLVMHDPMALIALKETGQCEVFLPEALFDIDYPGHFMRRIKSVSLTIPCVVGPYTSINCTLTLLSNKTRIKSEVGARYEEDSENDDSASSPTLLRCSLLLPAMHKMTAVCSS